MLPSPVAVEVPSAGAPPRAPSVAGRWRGGPAASGAVSLGWEAAVQPTAGPAAVGEGGCCAWPLSLDPTCAAEARSVFREAVAFLGLPADQMHDGVTMASELAANTLHAQENVEYDGAGRWPMAGAPELWLYLRRSRGSWELVCKVFDSVAGWRHGLAPVPGETGQESVSGRGLQVVAGMSQGRWGHHLTRARLGGWKVPGKAVWFTMPVPALAVPDSLRRTRLAPAKAATALETMFTERGLGETLLRVAEPSVGMSVLSIQRGLTVWCRDSRIWWRPPDGHYEQRVPTDLMDIAEEIVRTVEETRAGVPARDSRWDRVR